MNDKPKCGLCGVTMTPENSSSAPEYFLCDVCADEYGHHKPDIRQCQVDALPKLIGQLVALEKERADMLAFIREQVALWDNAGDTGFPLYEHGKRILANHPLTTHDQPCNPSTPP